MAKSCWTPTGDGPMKVLLDLQIATPETRGTLESAATTRLVLRNVPSMVPIIQVPMASPPAGNLSRSTS